MSADKLPPTLTALTIHLKNPEMKYLEIVLCRGALFALAEQRVNILTNLRKRIIQLTNVRCSPYRLKTIYDELESLNLTRRNSSSEIFQHKEEPYLWAQQIHKNYVKDHPGQRKDGSSTHDKLYYYFVTTEGEEFHSDLKKIFKNGIRYVENRG